MWKQDLESSILDRCNYFLLTDLNSPDIAEHLNTLKCFATLARELDLNPKLHQRIMSCYEQLHEMTSTKNIALLEFSNIQNQVNNWDTRYSERLKTKELFSGLNQQLSVIGQVIQKNGQYVDNNPDVDVYKMN